MAPKGANIETVMQVPVLAEGLAKNRHAGYNGVSDGGSHVGGHVGANLKKRREFRPFWQDFQGLPGPLKAMLTPCISS